MYLLIYIYLFIHHEYNDMPRMNGLIWERGRKGGEIESKQTLLYCPKRILWELKKGIVNVKVHCWSSIMWVTDNNTVLKIFVILFFWNTFVKY